jgi:hypothetical protein
MIRSLLFLLSTLMVLNAAEPSRPIILPPAEGAREGRALAREIISMRPGQDAVSTGVLKTRQPRTAETAAPVRFEIQITGTNWSSLYESPGMASGITKLTVIHKDGQPNEYCIVENGMEKSISGNQTMIPFAGSDFWVADLGLEFLFWPEQRVLRKEIRRGQSCSVLESINPNPAAGAYARVLSWVDIDTGGVINADAFGSDGKPMKEFIAKSVKKVRGQWELKEIEMNDRRTRSRTTLTFDLGTN